MLSMCLNVFMPLCMLVQQPSLLLLPHPRLLSFSLSYCPRSPGEPSYIRCDSNHWTSTPCMAWNFSCLLVCKHPDTWKHTWNQDAYMHGPDSSPHLDVIMNQNASDVGQKICDPTEPLPPGLPPEPVHIGGMYGQEEELQQQPISMPSCVVFCQTYRDVPLLPPVNICRLVPIAICIVPLVQAQQVPLSGIASIYVLTPLMRTAGHAHIGSARLFLMLVFIIIYALTLMLTAGHANISSVRLLLMLVFIIDRSEAVRLNNTASSVPDHAGYLSVAFLFPLLGTSIRRARSHIGKKPYLMYGPRCLSLDFDGSHLPRGVSFIGPVQRYFSSARPIMQVWICGCKQANVWRDIPSQGPWGRAPWQLSHQGIGSGGLCAPLVHSDCLSLQTMACLSPLGSGHVYCCGPDF